MTNPTQIAYGPIKAMIVEYGAFDPRTIGVPAKDCKFLVLPVGGGTWDAAWFATKTGARWEALELAQAYGVKIIIAD